MRYFRTSSATQVILTILALYGIFRSGIWIVDSATAPMIDVDVYRNAGNALLSGKDLYSDAASAHGLPYLYTPFASILFTPLHWLPLAAMHVIATIALLTALFAIIHYSLRYASPSIVRRRGLLITAAGIGAALALEPIAQNLKFGQINLLIGLAILLDLLRSKATDDPAANESSRQNGRYKLPCGVLLGLVAAIKLTPLLFVVYLFFSKRRDTAKTAGITFTICTTMGFLVAFPSSLDFWTSVAYDTSRVGVAFVTNQSINGFFSRILGGPEAVTFLYKIPALIIGSIGLLASIRLARRGDQMLGDVLCGITALLVSPISWSHHWVWLIPALAWLALSDQRPRWGRAAALAGFVLFWVSPIQWMPRGDGAEYHYTFVQMLESNAYLFAALAFFAYSANRARKLQVSSRPSVVAIPGIFSGRSTKRETTTA